MKPRRRVLVGVAGYGALLAIGSVFGSLGYFHFGAPAQTCASCHEMTDVHSGWSTSAHRTMHCRNCHGGSLTLDLHALESHVRRATQHFTGRVKPVIRLSERDLASVQASCRACHPQTFAEWQASRHTTTYGRIFLDPKHNATEQLADDCLRCHGMFFAGEMKTLVHPLDKVGPWKLLEPARETQPAIPCLACHQIHTPADAASPPHFYDRREETHFAAAALPRARVFDGGAQAVAVSSDPRQRLCQQCHAPNAHHRLGTSDDRTPAGVHAGLSCLDCHQMHTTSARASCSACHPANSHCGLDVTQMDTSHLSKTSSHDIHTVACRDCHPGGAPPPRAKPAR